MSIVVFLFLFYSVLFIDETLYVSFWGFMSWQHLRSYQGGHRVVSVHSCVIDDVLVVINTRLYAESTIDDVIVVINTRLYAESTNQLIGRLVC